MKRIYKNVVNDLFFDDVVLVCIRARCDGGERRVGGWWRREAVELNSG